jgi:riboflavin synthase
MFSGIIENKGVVKEFKKLKDYRLILDTDLNFKNIKKGSSVCCNGVCLTVTSKKRVSKKTRLTFDVSKETVDCTNFNQIKIGDVINIEMSLRVGDEISGHFVFGHVDETATLVSSKRIGASYELKFRISKHLMKFVAKKGSVAINGISLTINNIKRDIICLNIIPYTWNKTNLSNLTIGARINLEVDMLARYVTQDR